MTEFDRNWDQLPIAELHELDALCDRFEQAMAQDGTTRMERFISDLPQSQQRLVAPELMRLEIEARHAHGQPALPDEYAQRFPQWADELRAHALEAIDNTRSKSDTVKVRAASTSDTKANAIEPQASWADQWRQAMSGRSWAGLPSDGMLGHYQLVSVIGQGGMGLVVRAYDTTLAREVAIKILFPQIAHDANVNERFLREARAAAAIRHTHVVTIYAVETINHVSFLVMELVEGPTLEEHLRANGKLPAEEVARLACQMARGLAAAHKQGLIHRDVKPANILLEKVESFGLNVEGKTNSVPDPQHSTINPQLLVKLADFGLARVAAEVRLTSSGLIAGTPQFMSPEQANGQELDARSDLFSLGSVMYAMCAGRAPFEADSAIAIVRQVADQPARPLREVSPETPDWLVETIEKLMAKSPADRFRSAGELAELLNRHSHDAHTSSSLAPALSRVERERIGVRKTSLMRRKTTILSLAFVAIAIVALAVVMSGRDNHVDEVNSTLSSPIDPGDSATAVTVEESRYEWPADAPPPAIAPFTPAEATAHQRAWAKHLGVPVETDNSIGMKFRLIPPGEFLMGSSEQEIERELKEAKKQNLQAWYLSYIPYESPQHRALRHLKCNLRLQVI